MIDPRHTHWDTNTHTHGHGHTDRGMHMRAPAINVMNIKPVYELFVLFLAVPVFGQKAGGVLLIGLNQCVVGPAYKRQNSKVIHVNVSINSAL